MWVVTFPREQAGRRTDSWKTIKSNIATERLSSWPRAGLPGGYLRLSVSEVFSLPLFSMDGVASKFELLTRWYQISDTPAAKSPFTFEWIFFKLKWEEFSPPG